MKKKGVSSLSWLPCWRAMGYAGDWEGGKRLSETMFEAEQWKILDVHASLNRFQLNSTWTFSPFVCSFNQCTLWSASLGIRAGRLWLCLSWKGIGNFDCHILITSYLRPDHLTEAFCRKVALRGKSSVTGFSGLIFNRSFHKVLKSLAILKSVKISAVKSWQGFPIAPARTIIYAQTFSATSVAFSQENNFFSRLKLQKLVRRFLRENYSWWNWIKFAIDFDKTIKRNRQARDGRPFYQSTKTFLMNSFSLLKSLVSDFQVLIDFHRMKNSCLLKSFAGEISCKCSR